MFLELSVVQYRILNPLRCGKMPTSALLCLLLNSRDSLFLWFAVLSLFLIVEIVFETAMKVWGKHLRPLTPTGTDTSQDMSFRKCYLTSTIFWMMCSSIYSWTGQYYYFCDYYYYFLEFLSPDLAKWVNAPINVNLVGGWVAGGGGVRARGWDLTNFKIFWSNSPRWETKGQSKVSKKPPSQGKNLNKQYSNTI